MAQQQLSQAACPSILGPKHDTRNRTGEKSMKAVKGLRRRDGLLNTTIGRRPQLLHFAQQNATQSPLLRLPSELRDQIWRYALGDHDITIQTPAHSEPMSAVHDTQPLDPDTLLPLNFVAPTFQLPRVCRQIYFEAAAYIYTHNTFAFHNIAAFDKWIKNRCLGQRRLVKSLHAPRTYTRLYRSGLRKTFKEKFPNVQRIGIDNWTLFGEYTEIRRLPENKGRSAMDMWTEAKNNIINDVHIREGNDMSVEWHGQSA